MRRDDSGASASSSRAGSSHVRSTASSAASASSPGAASARCASSVFSSSAVATLPASSSAASGTGTWRANAVRAGRAGPVAPHDDRRLLLDVRTAGQAVAHAVDQAGAAVGRRSRLGTGRSSAAWAARSRAARLFSLLRVALVAFGEVGGHEVADRHVEVEQQADRGEEDQHDPCAGVSDSTGEHGADAEARSLPHPGRSGSHPPRPPRRGGTCRAARAPRGRRRSRPSSARPASSSSTA